MSASVLWRLSRQGADGEILIQGQIPARNRNRVKARSYISLFFSPRCETGDLQAYPGGSASGQPSQNALIKNRPLGLPWWRSG